MTPEETANYETLIRVIYIQEYGLKVAFEKDVPLKLSVLIYYEIPKATSKVKKFKMLSGEIRPTKKPDIDNVIKIIADSLNKLAYDDDKQIVECHCQKFYSENPRVELEIKKI